MVVLLLLLLLLMIQRDTQELAILVTITAMLEGPRATESWGIEGTHYHIMLLLQVRRCCPRLRASCSRR